MTRPAVRNQLNPSIVVATIISRQITREKTAADWIAPVSVWDYRAQTTVYCTGQSRPPSQSRTAEKGRDGQETKTGGFLRAGQAGAVHHGIAGASEISLGRAVVSDDLTDCSAPVTCWRSDIRPVTRHLRAADRNPSIHTFRLQRRRTAATSPRRLMYNTPGRVWIAAKSAEKSGRRRPADTASDPISGVTWRTVKSAWPDMSERSDRAGRHGLIGE